MNAHQRRTLARACKRYAVEVSHQQGVSQPWTVDVNGEPVTHTVFYMRRFRCFPTKAAAIRHGIAEAKRAAKGTP